MSSYYVLVTAAARGCELRAFIGSSSLNSYKYITYEYTRTLVLRDYDIYE